MKLSNPLERDNLRGYVADLYNPEYLKRAWIDGNVQRGDFPLDWVVNLLFDDTHYAEQPEDHLGESLLDAEEVAAVRRMVVALDTLLTATKGQRLTDADYLRTPQWPAVHEAAKALHALIVANDAKIAAT